MKAAGVPGTVNVDFLIDQFGKVLQPMASKSTSREFEAAAVEAVKQWDFSAAMKNGRPILMRMTVPIVFDPQKGEGVPGDKVKPVETAPPAWF
jgi:TonB family protein